MLHVTNGDTVAQKLRAAVPGQVVVWADVLHEGPVARVMESEAWVNRRAEFLASVGAGEQAKIARGLVLWNEQFARCTEHEQVVLWLEHDLFDQALLMRHLAVLSGMPLGQTRVSMVCIGQFPGVEPFHGLGQLSRQQLVQLLPTREAVTGEQLALGTRAWEAFAGDDPRAVEAVIESGAAALPFLREALRRHLQQFPSVGNGLNRTQQQALDVIEAGAIEAGEIFQQQSDREERRFLGDTMFWAELERMAQGDQPLVVIERVAGRPFAEARVWLTVTGERVRAGGADFVQLNGIDRWLGGVHLFGSEARWRWDQVKGRMVEA